MKTAFFFTTKIRQLTCLHWYEKPRGSYLVIKHYGLVSLRTNANNNKYK